MSLLGFLDGVVKVGTALVGFGQFQAVIKMERQAAMEHLSSMVETLPPQSLDVFEANFLQYSMALVDQRQRQRAMELYAWLKVSETARYREFRGFVGHGGLLQ